MIDALPSHGPNDTRELIQGFTRESTTRILWLHRTYPKVALSPHLDSAIRPASPDGSSDCRQRVYFRILRPHSLDTITRLTSHGFIKLRLKSKTLSISASQIESTAASFLFHPNLGS
jgi:hypothetical protein